MRKLLIFSLALFIASCSSKVQQNPPSAKYEKVSYGKPYVIRGIKYYPMKNVSEFEQTGYASWYGTEEHGSPTATGEIYNMYANTAAHKTLPLGSMVHVKNLENGRETVVRINDRGPFVKGRIIDLSYSGAKKMGIVEKGLAKVKITLLSEERDHLVVNGKNIDLGNRKFVVQVGSFSIYSNARNLASKFTHSNITTFYKDGTRYYRVHVTGFNSRKQAEKFIRKNKHKYPGAFVMVQD
jgi:rare lipoprotein A